MRHVRNAVAVALFAVSAAPHLGAQSKAASSPATPKRPGIWHRKGPLDGKPNPRAVPTNRAAGFLNAFDDGFNPTYDCSPTPIPGLINDDYDFQTVQQPDRAIIKYEKMDVVRTVWLEDPPHRKLENNDYPTQGFSVGHY